MEFAVTNDDGRYYTTKPPARGLARRLARPGCGDDLATPFALRQAASLSLPCLGGYHWLRTETSPTAASRTAPLVRPPRAPPRPRRRTGRPQAGTRQMVLPRLPFGRPSKLPRLGLHNACAVGLLSALLRSAAPKRGSPFCRACRAHPLAREEEQGRPQASRGSGSCRACRPAGASAHSPLIERFVR